MTDEEFLAPPKPSKPKPYVSPEARAEGIGPQPNPAERFGGGAKICGDRPLPRRPEPGLAWWQQVSTPTKMV